MVGVDWQLACGSGAERPSIVMATSNGRAGVEAPVDFRLLMVKRRKPFRNSFRVGCSTEATEVRDETTDEAEGVMAAWPFSSLCWSLELSDDGAAGGGLCEGVLDVMGAIEGIGKVGDNEASGVPHDIDIVAMSLVMSSMDLCVVRETGMPRLWAMWRNCRSTSSSVMSLSKRRTVVL